ncbi:hypothetical protein [Streptomyces sp. NPDC093970]|uniref:hypothetical protein n=1 Tax=Streptomyces sp. NPDC093970 TaxID=3155076 RepID=UPI003428EE26
MNARFGMKRKAALGVTALVAVAASAVPGSASTPSAEKPGFSDHWGVITRNTIGSPVIALRSGPFASFGVQGSEANPPFGAGSLGIEVADNSTSLTPPAERAAFGNELDFYGEPVLGLDRVGFHVFQTGENVSYGGPENLPNITFEINPNLAAAPATTYSSLVWAPDAAPAVNQWSPYLDATATGRWYLTGSAGGVTGCNLAARCTFEHLKRVLDDGGAQPTVYTAAVTKGRDHMWVGAVDGLRINRAVYDFEADGVRIRRAG